jgi:hypothetical protein
MRRVDNIYNSLEDVKKLIKEKKWEIASKYGDSISYRAVINNEDWWWHQTSGITTINPTWNSGAYGNAAIGIWYGRNFPERSSLIENLKDLLDKL